MDFRILGSLEVWDGERQLELGGPKRRALLAYLTLHANEVVAVDRLLDQLWGEKAPRNAAGALHTHVSRLRKELGTEVLATRTWGYVLRINPGELDLDRFERLVADAESLPASERAAKLREALALWRGPPLADLAFEPALVGGIARLEELRLTVLENRIDADLEAGSHDGLAAELEGLIAEHPLRERLRGQLILALYRSGRQAEALEVYRETRRVLVEELGIEPSPELKELERAILRQDPALASPTPSPTPTAVGPEIPPRRWRWPRSPLAIGAGLLVLAGAGLATALLAPWGAISQNVNGPTPANAGGSQALTVGPHHSLPLTTQQLRETSERQTTRTEQRPATTSTKQHTTTVVATTQSTTTHPTTTHSQHQKPPAAKWVYLLMDDFENPDLDRARWNLYADNDAAVATETNGRLEVAIDASRAPPDHYFNTHYESQCEVFGNFDEKVDFTLLTWPIRDGINVFLRAQFPGSAYSTFVARTGQTAGEGGAEVYSTAFGPWGTGIPTGDSSGSLRIARKGGLMVTYYKYGKRWITLGSRPAPGGVRFQIGIDTNVGQFGFQTAALAFDNFQATADTVDCGGFPLPPRKRLS